MVILGIGPAGLQAAIHAARVESKSIVIATGTSRNKLGVPGEAKLLGRGVSYCVECDANFFKGEDVCVVGGESAAAGGALTRVHSSKSFGEGCVAGIGAASYARKISKADSSSALNTFNLS